MPARRLAARRGFVLPTSMLVVTLLTVMLAAAFILVSADYRTTDNAFASSRSLAIAQAGLQDYFSVGHNLTGQSSDSTGFAFGNGWAMVIARKLRDSVGTTTPSLWVVRSTGFDTVRALLGQPNGQRTVAQFATYQSGMLPARAAVVAVNGVKMTPNPAAAANPISGYNTGFTPATYNPPCTPPAAADTTGLTVGASGDYFGGSGIDPSRGIEYLGSATAVYDSTHVDWPKLVAGQFTPDFRSSLPPLNNNTYYSYYYPGSVTVPAGQRRGLLVAGGDVVLADMAHWDGVIVAGGKFMADTGNYMVHGMVVSGLNGTTVPNSIRRVWPLLSGYIRVIQWDWCYAHASISSLSYLVPIKNAWVDTWSTF